MADFTKIRATPGFSEAQRLSKMVHFGAPPATFLLMTSTPNDGIYWVAGRLIRVRGGLWNDLQQEPLMPPQPWGFPATTTPQLVTPLYKEDVTKPMATSEAKLASRRWMYHTYRHLTQLDRLDPEGQYWTLAGSIADEHGKLLENSEPDQAMKEGFMVSEQYVGVEQDAERVRKGQETQLLIEEGHFRTVLNKYWQQDNLFPAFVNLDTMHEPVKARQEASYVMKAISCVDYPCVMFVNVVMQSHSGIHYTADNLFDQWRGETGWNYHYKSYPYKSLQRPMEIFCFQKKGK